MYKNIQLKDNLKDGLLLLEMSPKKDFKSYWSRRRFIEYK